MNGLTTIAALPAAAGCKASLSAEKVRANAPGAPVVAVDYIGHVYREFGWGVPHVEADEGKSLMAALKRAQRRERNP
jgi:transketolase N-terminal domain/subunit